MKHRKFRKHVNIGTVSHGTMRPEDLIPAFLAELESQKPLQRKHRSLVADITKRLAEPDYYSDGPDDSVQYDMDALFDALDCYCAPYFYFGTHPGDGSDYGYWLSDSFQDDFEGIIESCNGMRSVFTQCGDTIDAMPKGYTGEFLHVNDHGNMTLYNCSHGRRYQVWSIV